MTSAAFNTRSQSWIQTSSAYVNGNDDDELHAKVIQIQKTNAKIIQATLSLL